MELRCKSQAGTPSCEQSGIKLLVTGIFAVLCVHGFFLANGVVDLAKGEG